MPFSNLLTSARLIARPGLTVLIAILALAGCGKNDLVGGALSGVANPGAPEAANRAPSINGIPPSTAKVNQLYDFTPSAFDPDGDPVRFEISGKPSWASFNANSGRLYGTPPAGTSGTFGGIEIRATDGAAKSTLPTFSILVLESAAAVSGPAVLNWSRPTTNTDGTPLTNLAGYRIYYGTLPSQLTSVREITDPATISTSISGLAAGTWYFAISTVTAAGAESSRSSAVSVSIG